VTPFGPLLGARDPPDTTKAGRLPGFDAKRGSAALKFSHPNPEGLTAAIVATRRAYVNGELLVEGTPHAHTSSKRALTGSVDGQASSRPWRAAPRTGPR
jgi:hypothetical protein